MSPTTWGVRRKEIGKRIRACFHLPVCRAGPRTDGSRRRAVAQSRSSSAARRAAHVAQRTQRNARGATHVAQPTWRNARGATHAAQPTRRGRGAMHAAQRTRRARRPRAHPRCAPRLRGALTVRSRLAGVGTREHILSSAHESTSAPSARGRALSTCQRAARRRRFGFRFAGIPALLDRRRTFDDR